MPFHPDTPIEYRDAVVLADCVDFVGRLPDESVDMIMTDPPYLRKYLHLYKWLAKEAMRVLKPGGYIYAYGGAEFTPEIIRYMSSAKLTYFWEFHLRHRNKHPRVYHKRLMSAYKPVFAFTKGKPRISRWQFTSGLDGGMDKRYHAWGQHPSFSVSKITLCTDAGDVVLDPFCGGGTTAEACKLTGRHWLTCDSDPEAVRVAEQRVAELNPLDIYVEHVEMDLDVAQYEMELV
jgi:DNA modification methylase